MNCIARICLVPTCFGSEEEESAKSFPNDFSTPSDLLFPGLRILVAVYSSPHPASSLTPNVILDARQARTSGPLRQADIACPQARMQNSPPTMDPDADDQPELPGTAGQGSEPLACVTCRSRKLKCDRVKQACGRCLKVKRECVYPESRRKPAFKRRNVKELEERLGTNPRHVLRRSVAHDE